MPCDLLAFSQNNLQEAMAQEPEAAHQSVSKLLQRFLCFGAGRFSMKGRCSIHVCSKKSHARKCVLRDYSTDKNDSNVP